MVSAQMTRRSIAIGATAGALALAGGLWALAAARCAAPGLEGVARAPGGSLDEQLAALREQLAVEKDARLGLAAEVEMLRELFSEHGAGSRFDAPPPGTAAAASGAQTDALGEATSSEKPWFDSQALTAQGISAPDIARLQSIFEESELEVLYLRDQAAREGWAGTGRFMQALYALRSGLREKIGDEKFDCLLYATQSDNRVAALSVLSTGPAARAGLQPNDLILRYDGRTIFRAGELQRLTSQGEKDRPVPMDVLSPDGRERRLTVPSGPLGVQLNPTRRPPAACG
jgi:hypothetical protein